MARNGPAQKNGPDNHSIRTSPRRRTKERRRDQPRPDAPATVPHPGEGIEPTGSQPPEDGGVEQHPIHDSDIEDLGPRGLRGIDRRGREDRDQGRHLTHVEMTAAACDHDAMSLSPSPSPSQNRRLARRPFILAVIALYVLSFASQMLLSAPVTAQMSVVPFVLVQIVLIPVWIVVHQRRLRDAGRPTGIAIGVALIYALQVVLLTLLIWMLTPNSGTGDFAGSGAGVFHLVAILYLLGTMAGDPSLSGLQIWLMGFAAVMFLPVLIAIFFSLWAATRPSLIPHP